MSFEKRYRALYSASSAAKLQCSKTSISQIWRSIHNLVNYHHLK
jgi:hypothetical protein